MPAQKNLSVWRGNTLDQVFWFKTGTTPIDLTGSTMVFTAVWTGGSLRKDNAGAGGFSITNAAGGEATLSLSVAETRAFPVGENVVYEIERWISGKQTTLLWGKLSVGGQVNVDV